MITYPETILQHIVEQIKYIIKSDNDEHTKIRTNQKHH